MILEDYERIAREAMQRARTAKTWKGRLWNLQIYAKAQERVEAIRAAGPFAGVGVPDYTEDL